MEIDVTGTEARLCLEFAKRQRKGITKYDLTVEENPLSLREWLWHSLEEKMDDCVYMLRAIEEIDKVIK